MAGENAMETKNQSLQKLPKKEQRQDASTGLHHRQLVVMIFTPWEKNLDCEYSLTASTDNYSRCIFPSSPLFSRCCGMLHTYRWNWYELSWNDFPLPMDWPIPKCQISANNKFHVIPNADYIHHVAGGIVMIILELSRMCPSPTQAWMENYKSNRYYSSPRADPGAMGQCLQR